MFDENANLMRRGSSGGQAAEKVIDFQAWRESGVESGYDPKHVHTQEGGVVLSCPPTLEEAIGRGPAKVLCQLAYKINRSTNLHEGRYWWYDSVKQMRDKYFLGWKSNRTVQRNLAVLITENDDRPALLSASNFNFQNRFDHTKWYALTEAGAIFLAQHGVKLRREIWELLPEHLRKDEVLYISSEERRKQDSDKMYQSKGTKYSSRNEQNVSADENKMPQSIFKDSSPQNLYNSKDIPNEEETKKALKKPLGSMSITEYKALKMPFYTTLDQECLPCGKKKKQKAVEALIRLGATPDQIPIVIKYTREKSHFDGKPHYSQVAEKYLAAMADHAKKEEGRREIEYLGNLTMKRFELEQGLAPHVQTVLEKALNYIDKYRSGGASGYWNLERLPGYNDLGTVAAIEILLMSGSQFLERSPRNKHFYKPTSKGWEWIRG